MPFPSHSGRDPAPYIRRVTRDAEHTFGPSLRVLCTRRLDEVSTVLEEAEREAAAGKIAVGFVGFDAAPAFDSALVAHRNESLPLAWFSIHSGAASAESRVSGAQAPTLEWRPGLTPPDYYAALDRIRAWIAAGDSYQVNYTFPMHAHFAGDAHTLFETLAAAQPTDYGWLIDTGEFAVLSVSPEQFFRLDGDRIVCKPMKGTAPRGLWHEDDEQQARLLRASEKDRAENVMIVDMVRNDLGRIAETGTVRVVSLFDTERLDTCWQMTSTIEAHTRATLPQIFSALFPSASVTGAPKVRTMQIIRELESAPRGVYCGAIGTIGPGRRAEFSVGIRTVTIDRERKTATYNVGSGITWDSAPHAEFEECRIKAAVLTHRPPAFDLLESLRWDGEYWLLDAHLDRLRNSATYFGFEFGEQRIREALEWFKGELTTVAKVRLTLSRRGHVEITATPLGEAATWRIGVSPEPIDAADVFLYHKTTHRAVYDRASILCPGVDDVILWNERRELTESTRANIVLRMGETWFTPPVSAGLLGGVYRAHLLRDGALRERVLTLNDLDVADEIRLINSVRGWIAVDRSLHPMAGRV